MLTCTSALMSPRRCAVERRGERRAAIALRRTPGVRIVVAEGRRGRGRRAPTHDARTPPAPLSVPPSLSECDDRFVSLAALLVLGGGLFVGARPIGPAPALGPFLEPAHGVWSLARAAASPAAGTRSVARSARRFGGGRVRRARRAAHLRAQRGGRVPRARLRRRARPAVPALPADARRERAAHGARWRAGARARPRDAPPRAAACRRSADEREPRRHERDDAGRARVRRRRERVHRRDAGRRAAARVPAARQASAEVGAGGLVSSAHEPHGVDARLHRDRARPAPARGSAVGDGGGHRALPG